MDPEQARKMLEGMGLDMDELMKQAADEAGGAAGHEHP